MRVVRTANQDRRAWTGNTIDLRETTIPAGTVRRAIVGDAEGLTVEAPNPSRWWPALGVPADGTAAIDRLVAAARSRGVAVPAERRLAAAQRALANHSVEQVDVKSAQKRLADAGANVAQLREAVAMARGRLAARRETNADTEAAEEALASATARLSEAETERVAAKQAHAAVHERAREARSARERRLRLQDRVANHRRDARRALLTAIADEFAGAVEAVPGDATLSLDPLGVDGDSSAASLAAIRLASLQAPVVLDTASFDGVTTASECLDVLVICC